MSAGLAFAAASGAATSARAPLAPRIYTGQMCGIHLAGAPPVDGGAADASLILSWFRNRYPTNWRARIDAAYRERYPDVLHSWCDDRAVGLSPTDHVARLQEQTQQGLRPCEMLTSKLYCPEGDAAGTLAIVHEVLPLLVAADCVSRYCVGFEMNLWNSYASLQGIIDGVAALVVPHRPLVVHFSPGYADWRPDHPGSTFAEFWNAQVGKLTGLWHQADPNWWNVSQPAATVAEVATRGSASVIDLVRHIYRAQHGHWLDDAAPRQTVAQPAWGDALYQALLADVTGRFAGNFNVSPDSGFGHPFDCTALEISAAVQYDASISEAEGNRRGDVALATPGQHGPGGYVVVMGSGNGQSR